MSIRRVVQLLLAVAPAAVVAQDPAPAPGPSVRLSAAIVERADAPEFAAREADRVLQNLAEVVRQLGARVARVDTVALGVSRLPEANGVGGYPPPPYEARYLLRVEVARGGDVTDVSTALSAAGAASVWRAGPPARR
jgi:hypothetical protein